MVKQRKLKWVVYVAHKVQIRTVYKVLIKNVTGRDTLGDIGIDKTGILK
jgi:hypothetical protein